MANTQSLEKLGKYTILEKVGEGGFGIVYRAHDPFLERDVAIKVLRSEFAAAPNFLERFKREARLAASLSHPNIVHIIEVGEQDGYYYLVMDYLAGNSLFSQLKEGEPVTLARVIEILGPIASALDYAHSRKIIHRDVKPSNILFTEEGRPMLADFGLVRDTHEAQTTTTGVVLGSPEYMAPEQIKAEEVSPAADRYALGVVAYQMLCGQVPFNGKTEFEVKTGHVTRPIPSPQTLNPALPADAAAVLQRALDKQPDQRYETAQAFVGALQQIDLSILQRKAAEMENAARKAISNNQYEEAIGYLNEALSLHPAVELNKLLEECKVRQQTMEKYNDISTRHKQITIELDQLALDNPWLPKPAKVRGLSLAHVTQQPPKAKPIERIFAILRKISIFASIAASIAGIVFLTSSQSVQHVNSYYYIDDIEILLGILILSSALWIIYIAVAGFQNLARWVKS